ncbi:histidine utilization repressor [Mesorhizobium sp. KR9-304]|uniref:histidine utilization repressor n=1 Tax=Mesorhizobium sp. KR9-304 TaxID=3156614 RepID=UPI0032B3EBDB
MDAKTAGTDGSGALYQRILSDIRGRILSGEWAPGHRIPFEHELAAEYQCSRMTVNKAMSELARTGLIERRRRSGSFVKRPQSQAAILEIHDIRAEVEALGLPYRYELVSQAERMAAGPDEDAGFPEGTLLVELVCRHFAGAQPFCLEERAISLAAVPEAAGERFEEVAPGPWLLSRVPWNAAEHTIRAVAADENVAKMLGLPRHSPCLVVNRRTWSADQPVTNVTLTYAGETHSLVARFAPQKG